MFESLTAKIEKAISNMRGYGKISNENVEETVRMIRLALLEADVNYKVVKEFTNKVKDKALGEEVIGSLKPGEVFLKIIKEELLLLLGSGDNQITKKNSIVMLIGLQGSGKTTTAGKLSNLLRKKNSAKPLLIAADVYRPAAIDQLKTIGKELSVEVYSESNKNVVDIVKNGVKYAKDNKFDTIIIDTAGRLYADELLIKELQDINQVVNPNEVILVIDAMIGQDAINVINGFNDALKLTGAILTKMDGDTKAGVALSLRHLTNIPIKYIGTSEKLDGIDVFDSSRIVDRILGEGDILSLIEKAESVISKDEASALAKKLNKGKFDLGDFLLQLKQIKKLGPLENLIKLIPGASKMGLNNINIDPKQLTSIEAIIQSMTPQERTNPNIIKASRKIRISNGSGTTVQEVNKLLKQFEQMQKMMKLMKNNGGKLPF